MNILIVDENEVVRRQLFWALRRGNALHEAAGRAEARAILAGLQPDVILLELLEEGDADESPGVALVEELLGVPNPPIILIITRSNRKDVAARLLRMGVLDIFSKPLNL